MQDLGHRRLGAPGEPFRILQATDLHHFPKEVTEFDVREAKGRVVQIGEGTRYSTQGDVELLEAVLERVRPHLVVLTGDVIDGRPFKAPPGEEGEKGGWRRTLLEVLAPIVRQGCAWTFVPGNHDDDGSPWSRADLLDVYRLGDEAPGCISEGAESFDHTVTLGPSQGFDEASSLRLWLMDSGGNHEDKALRYHTFSSSAVTGVRRLSESLPAAGCELAYFHIPPPQAGGLKPVHGRNLLFDAALTGGMVPAPWKWQPFTTVVRCIGMDRVVGASKLESGMFDALAKESRVRACFFGHDHHSDAVFWKDGLYMAYGRVGGTTPPIEWEGDAPLQFERGARVVEWDPAKSSGRGDLRTWIEVASGTESGSEFAMDGQPARL